MRDVLNEEVPRLSSAHNHMAVFFETATSPPSVLAQTSVDPLPRTINPNKASDVPHILVQ